MTVPPDLLFSLAGALAGVGLALIAVVPWCARATKRERRNAEHAAAEMHKRDVDLCERTILEGLEREKAQRHRFDQLQKEFRRRLVDLGGSCCALDSHEKAVIAWASGDENPPRKLPAGHKSAFDRLYISGVIQGPIGGKSTVNLGALGRLIAIRRGFGG